jgi:hypothetical protein
MSDGAQEEERVRTPLSGLLLGIPDSVYEAMGREEKHGCGCYKCLFVAGLGVLVEQLPEESVGALRALLAGGANG